MRWFRKSLLLILIMFIVALAGCGSGDTEGEEASGNSDSKGNGEEATTDEDGFGGALNIALDAQPPNLDAPTTPATSARDGARLIFETLVTTDEDYQPVPMLAESIDISDDNKVYTFKLREGIKFHNGKEMIAEDVVASMERWMEKSTITGLVFEGATWTEEDDYTVVLELEESSSLTLDTLASAKMAAVVMPKEIVESAPPEGVEEYIGTGPYEFVEWKQDQYIHFTRYEDYQPVEDEPSGLAGKKVAYFDDLYFHIVPDSSTRLTGLQTGEYDFAYGIPYDNYEQVESDPNIYTIVYPSSNAFVHFNKNHGITQDYKFREAVNVGIDIEEMMIAGYPNPDLYELDSGYMDPNIKNWASSAGSEYYNINDPERAKEILEEINYDGEEFTIMVTRDYPQLYQMGVVMQEQLNNIGINTELDVVDWPTFNDKMQNHHQDWDAFIVGSSTVSTPPQLLVLSPTFAGGLDDPKVHEMMRDIETAPTLEEAQGIWDELQHYAWEEVLPIINLGITNSLMGVRDHVEGVTAFTGPVFWNAKFVE